MLRQKGFTLFEVLIALFIFAILGVMATVCLHVVIKTHDKLSVQNERLLKVQIAMLLFERDVSQIMPRPVMSANQQRLPAVLSHGSSELEFTTAGNYNPHFVYKSSSLKRVAYGLKDHELIELIWPVLDRVQATSTPYKKILLKHVQSLQFQFVSKSGSLSSFWPNQSSYGNAGKKNPNTSLPKAIEMRLQLKKMGGVTRIVNLAGASPHEAS